MKLRKIPIKKEKISIIVMATIIFIGFVSYSSAGDFPTVVETEYGRIEGLLGPDNDTVSWVGIPFAKPPVGDLRWKRPDDPEKWDGVRQAFEFCDQCTQYNEAWEVVGSEDCLYLNVWRPDSEETDLPVYFWIHGGGNSIGSAIYTSYDGSHMASSNNVVVVSTNYRLGPLGWFTHPSLRKDKKGSQMSDSGNYGTLDIIMALKWVKENIGSFGGNPKNVTIAGESSGGANVFALLLSPLAAGLFHKAIVQSGFPWADSVEAGDESAEDVIDELMASDGISDLKDGMKENQIADYLRSKSAEDILLTYTPGPTGMLDTNKPDAYNEFCHIFTDGTVLPSDDFFPLILSGQYNKVPIIIGSNEEEQKLNLFPSLISGNMDPCSYQQYALSETEASFGALTNLMANLLSIHQPEEVYVYRFLYGTYRYLPQTCEPDPNAFNAWSGWFDPNPYDEFGPFHLGLAFGACHTLVVPFFFGNFEFLIEELTPLIFPLDYAGYQLLSDAMMKYTANFAYTGNPGVVDGVTWEPCSVPTVPPPLFMDTPANPRILFDADEDEAIIEVVP